MTWSKFCRMAKRNTLNTLSLATSNYILEPIYSLCMGHKVITVPTIPTNPRAPALGLSASALARPQQEQPSAPRIPAFAGPTAGPLTCPCPQERAQWLPASPAAVLLVGAGPGCRPACPPRPLFHLQWLVCSIF